MEWRGTATTFRYNDGSRGLLFGTIAPPQNVCDTRIVARKSSVGGLDVCVGGLTFKFDKNFTNI